MWPLIPPTIGPTSRGTFLCIAEHDVLENTRFMAAALANGISDNGVVRRANRRDAIEKPDVYGAWTAMDEDEYIREDAGRLRHFVFEYLSHRMIEDLRLRGMTEARIWTFQSRINAVRAYSRNDLVGDAHGGPT